MQFRACPGEGNTLSQQGMDQMAEDHKRLPHHYVSEFGSTGSDCQKQYIFSLDLCVFNGFILCFHTV